MKPLAKTIMEQVVSGKISKEAATELLVMLKRAGGSRAPSGDMAIVGIALKLPGADTVEQFWHRIREGTDCIGPFPESRIQDVECLIPYTYLNGKEIRYCEGGFLEEIDKFDYKFFNIPPKEANLMDPAHRLLLEVLWHCLEDAGYGGGQLVGSRTGLYVGYSGWPMYGQFVSHAEPESFELSVLGNISAMMAKRLPQLLNLRGPSMLIDTSCSSSLVALHLAAQAIRQGECDQAVVAGVRLLLMPVEGGITYGIESANSRARVFDDEADGTVLSEGIAAILIKPLQQALHDRDRIYAVLKGSAINQDGSSTGVTTPNAQAQEDVMVRAWEASGVDPETITYIEAMGSATKIGDPIEIEAIQKAFRRFTAKRQFCAIGSLKSNIGHTDSTAGLAAVIKCALALQHKEIPPSLHFRRPSRRIAFEHSPVYVNNTLAEWKCDGGPRRCGINSFGFSGTNCHVVLEEDSAGAGMPEPTHSKETPYGGLNVFTLSAMDGEALNRYVNQYLHFLRLHWDESVENICFTANTGRKPFKHRLAVIVSNIPDLFGKLSLAAQMRQEGTDLEESGIFYGVQSDDRSEPIADLDPVSFQTRADGLKELCRKYVRGASVQWDRWYANQRCRRVSLPVYPFERKRCWLKTSKPEDRIGVKLLAEEIAFHF